MFERVELKTQKIKTYVEGKHKNFTQKRRKMAKRGKKHGKKELLVLMTKAPQFMDD